MPAWFVVLVGGSLIIASIAVLGGTVVNEWLNDHRWVLPAVSLLLVVVIALIVGGFSDTLRNDQVAACQRANGEKVGEIENLEHDRAFLRAVRTLVKDVLPPGGEYRLIVGATTRAIEEKSEAIGSKVASRAQFSEHPGGAPAKAVIIDCEEAYSR